ncbi:hypothetical protein, partial [Bradyrhizobium sp. LeoA1S1]
VTPSSISSFGRRLSSAHIAESKSVKNSGENTICQSSVRPCTHKPCGVMRRTQCPLCPYSGRVRAAAQYVAMGQNPKWLGIISSHPSATMKDYPCRRW